MMSVQSQRNINARRVPSASLSRARRNQLLSSATRRALPAAWDFDGSLESDNNYNV